MKQTSLRMRGNSIAAIALMARCASQSADGFSPSSRIVGLKRSPFSSFGTQMELKGVSSPARSLSHQKWVLAASGKDRQKVDAEYRNEVLAESEKRGKLIFVASLLVVLWSFSIPIELRRTHWCFTDQCVQSRSACFDCLTFGEWCGKVVNFYQNTPASDWVHFDFSVDPDFMTNLMMN
mmetsp:Transcript_9504/g.20108  ORF Transcript_9504/g.20108 Transcript_9504/m.20108 type:complete len:179 (-) Transcript_9504:37-573(-)|eukprot:CAMPEP_0183311518 /NCGR_PEP_ID=MMETSP0160_2-20130417/37370_1 /TAXON_ID=2839 ORGANISM="Odontella Sinensis, Strain Grunow 1884" /NCGR_SAMPLE_ID=MMETSP0160_2 /ASSEMBLY_ACC=CAM_ASM_000250 /LENGTH=178 /DNA_ID=CAMNT_0025476127 /DNA_START=45 /DNA_END=581 /DNA_ORIENTATION=-